MAGEELLAVHTKQFIFELSGKKKLGKVGITKWNSSIAFCSLHPPSAHLRSHTPLQI